MKSVWCVVLIAIAALGSMTFGADCRWGRFNKTDVLLFRDNVIRLPLKNDYQKAEANFPVSGHGNKRTISAVYVFDRFTNSSGSYCSLWSGGPGSLFASIYFKSQYKQGINSTVEIYGQK